MVSKRWAALLLTAYALLLAAPALAHARLVAASPGNGVTLDEPPILLRLAFNENIGEGSEVALIGRSFDRISGVGIREIVGNEVFVDVPTLAPGVYTVQYDVVSADDHTISGSYEFGVAEPPQPGALLSGAVSGVGLALLLVAALIYRRWRRSVSSQNPQS